MAGRSVDEVDKSNGVNASEKVDSSPKDIAEFGFTAKMRYARIKIQLRTWPHIVEEEQLLCEALKLHS